MQETVKHASSGSISTCKKIPLWLEQTSTTSDVVEEIPDAFLHAFFINFWMPKCGRTSALSFDSDAQDSGQISGLGIAATLVPQLRT